MTRNENNKYNYVDYIESHFLHSKLSVLYFLSILGFKKLQHIRKQYQSTISPISHFDCLNSYHVILF
jgi:hypothetical protein